ncbi:MAG TPA: amidohydrolase family protein [bacterium]|nr:amidohydrolase family protein [bacterium]
MRGVTGSVDIGITAGRIGAIHPRLGPASREVDAAGRLVTESFVDPHLHLDKVYTLRMLDEEALRAYHGAEMAEAHLAIALAARVKERYDRAWILPHVRTALRGAVTFGVTHVRAFADVDRKARLEGIAALLEARTEFAHEVTVEVVAFPQDGVVREPGAASLVREAVEQGADVVGGIPWIEASPRDAQAHIDAMFEIAVESDRPISMLVDDTGNPALRTLEMLAHKTIEVGWEGRVVAHHARAMARYDAAYLRDIIELLQAARLAVVTDPHTGPLHVPVRELMAAGITVCLGQDDISDAYYPYGRHNMLEVAFLASHLLWMTTGQDRERLYDMVTRDAARALGLPPHELRPGGVADLVVLDAPDLLEAFRHHGPPHAVIRQGQLIAAAQAST